MSFFAFYPTRPYWAVKELDLAYLQSIESPNDKATWFTKAMSEEVYKKVGTGFTLKVEQDGRISLLIDSIEAKWKEPSALTQDWLKAAVRLWGEYLEYANAFYLLLDSACIESNVAYFNLDEITRRDAFRYSNNSEIIADESIAFVFQKRRFLSQYPNDVPISFHLAGRVTIPTPVFEAAAAKFAEVVEKPALRKVLASYAKSLAEYKSGNNEISIVLSWFIIEAGINHFWTNRIDNLRQANEERITKDRKKFLTGRDFSASVMSNVLELFDHLPGGVDFLKNIDAVRKCRNDIAHNLKQRNDTLLVAMTGLGTAHEMIKHMFAFEFRYNSGFSVKF